MPLLWLQGLLTSVRPVYYCEPVKLVGQDKQTMQLVSRPVTDGPVWSKTGLSCRKKLVRLITANDDSTKMGEYKPSQRALPVTNLPFDSSDHDSEEPIDAALASGNIEPAPTTASPVQPGDSTAALPGEKPQKRGHAILAWIVIVLMLAVILSRQLLFQAPPELVSEAFDGLAAKQLELQGKVMVGTVELQSQLFKAAGKGEIGDEEKEAMEKAEKTNLESVKEMAGGSLGNRIRTAILIGELGDASAAVERIENTQQLVDREVREGLFEPTPRDEKLLRLTEQLYLDYAKSDFESHSLTPAEQTFLQENLEWYGTLALHPETESPDATRDQLLRESATILVVMVGFLMLLLALFLSGLIVAAGYGLFLGMFNLLPRAKWLQPSITMPGLNGGLYAETFAIWLAFYFGGSVSLMFLGIPKGWGMIAQLMVFFGSLIVVGWPVLRGVPFSRVRREIGWTFDSPWEPVLGLINYAATLPLLMIGAVFSAAVALVIAAFTPEVVGATSQLVNAQGPTHPIAFEIGQADWSVRIQLILLACVAAPIVEETMFRGVLYRHLRDFTMAGQIGTSVILSAFINAFIFAIVHPQGPVAVPVLMSLAIGFSLSREWRGSLVAPMVSHAMHNGLIMAFALYILS